MLLRSSSTPVLGSLISSIAAESPNNNNNHYHETSSSPFRHNHHKNKLSFHPSPGSLHLSTIASCASSPSVGDHFTDSELKGFRRAQSEGNLEGLARATCDANEDFFNQYQQQQQPNKRSARNNHLMLETIPSFSFHNSKATCEEEEYESDFDFYEEEEEEEVMAVSGASSHGFNSISMENMLLNEPGGLVGVGGQETCLSRGLETAIDGGAGAGGWGGGRGEFNSSSSSGDGGGGGGGGGGDNRDVEEFYKRAVEENPGNSLFLGNYARFLYQTKKDLEGAEEYYSRAILADPKDGEILSQYAKLVWELHHDDERASSYFERAVQASPQDSHVHAAYASFLWETEDDGDECSAPIHIDTIPSVHVLENLNI